MDVVCASCGEHFDDARRSTVCPHSPLMSDADLVQKDLAISLIGKDVRFAHQRETGPDHQVQSVGAFGMVTLRGMVGEFAPHLFVVA